MMCLTVLTLSCRSLGRCWPTRWSCYIAGGVMRREQRGKVMKKRNKLTQRKIWSNHGKGTASSHATCQCFIRHFI